MTTRGHKLEITSRTPGVMADDLAIHPTEAGVWVTRFGRALFLFRGERDASDELGEGRGVYVSGQRGLRYTADGSVLHAGLFRVDFPSLDMRGIGATAATFASGLGDADQEWEGYQPALAATCFDPTVTVHSAVWKPVRNKPRERKLAPPARLIVFGDAKREYVADLTPGLVDGELSVQGLACSKRWVVAVGTRVTVWDRADGYKLVPPGDVGAGAELGMRVAISPDDAVLAVVHDGELRLVEPATRAVLARQQTGVGPALALAYSPDGRWLAVGGRQGLAVVPTDGKSLGEPLRVDLGEIIAVTAVAFEPDSQALRAVYAGSPGAAVRVAIR